MKKIKKKKGGLPKEVIDYLNVKKVIKPKDYRVKLTVTKHQTRISIPAEIRRKMNLKKDQKCTIKYDKKNKEIICKF